MADIYGSTKQFHVVNVFGSSEQIAQNLLNVGNHSGKRVQLVSQNSQQHRQNQQHIPEKATPLPLGLSIYFKTISVIPYKVYLILSTH